MGDHFTAAELLLRQCHARVPRPEWGAVVMLVAASEHFAGRADRPQGAALNDLLLSILRVGGGVNSVCLGNWHEDWDDDDQHRAAGAESSPAATAEFRPSNNASLRDLFPNKFERRTDASAKASGAGADADAEAKPTPLHAFFSPPSAGGAAAKSTRDGGTLHGFFTSSKKASQGAEAGLKSSATPAAATALRPVLANGRRPTSGGSARVFSTVAADRAAVKAYRTEEARARNVPAFCIFSNKVLESILERRPSSREELLGIPGMGKRKVRRIFVKRWGRRGSGRAGGSRPSWKQVWCVGRTLRTHTNRGRWPTTETSSSASSAAGGGAPRVPPSAPRQSGGRWRGSSRTR
jgi:hypothetical protein